MIGLLDPALFLPYNNYLDSLHVLDQIVGVCRKKGIGLPEFHYWQPLWNEVVRPFEQQLAPQHKRTVAELRKLGKQSSVEVVLASPTPTGAAWKEAFNLMFTLTGLSEQWPNLMAVSLLQALHVANGRQVVLFVRQVLGRNLHRHAVGESIVDETTRYYLAVHPNNQTLTQIPLIHHWRNLELDWTRRFDWRLPAASDGARYPFCPVDNWRDPSLRVVRTMESKPVWLDGLGNGWARPSIAGGTGYHWDVYIKSPKLQQRIGLDQINVVEFGAPASEGRPGTIHHVPAEKRSALSDRGWACNG